MEIVLPFNEKTISSEISADEIEYRAILSKDSLFYIVLAQDEKFTLGKVDVKDITARKNDSDVLSDFSKKRIAFNNPIFTLVPDSEFEEEHVQSYLTFSNQITDTDKYTFSSVLIEDFNIRLVYAVPTILLVTLKSHLGSFDYTHYQNSFLSSLGKENSGKKITASLIGNNLNIALVDNSKLLMSNTYAAYNESEFYYFISLLFDQYHIKAGDAEIVLLGDFAESQLDRNRCNQLFGVFPKYLSMSGTIDKIETSTSYMPLIHLNKCASSQDH